MKNQEVVWKELPGYEGLYAISDTGEIYSEYYSRIMKPYISRNGYKKVHLTKNKNHTTHYVHRLVALTFIKNPKQYSIVNHIDENKLNNNVSNLEWCTTKYNINYGTAIERRKAHYFPRVWGFNGKEFLYFGSYQRASSQTGISLSVIRDIAAQNYNVYNCSRGWTFGKKKDFELMKTNFSRSVFSKKVRASNGDKVLIFDTVKDAKHTLGIKGHMSVATLISQNFTIHGWSLELIDC